MSCATNELYKSIVVNGLCWCAGRWVGCREEGRGQMSTPPVATKGPLPPLKAYILPATPVKNAQYEHRYFECSIYLCHSPSMSSIPKECRWRYPAYGVMALGLVTALRGSCDIYAKQLRVIVSAQHGQSARSRAAAWPCYIVRTGCVLHEHQANLNCTLRLAQYKACLARSKQTLALPLQVLTAVHHEAWQAQRTWGLGLCFVQVEAS